MIRTVKSRISSWAGVLMLLSVFLFSSCKWKKSVTDYVYGKTPVVEIGQDVLYAEDIKQVLPLGLELGAGCPVLSECHPQYPRYQGYRPSCRELPPFTH